MRYIGQQAVTSTAMKTVEVLYPNVLDTGYFLYTIDDAGCHFHTPVLSEFMRNCRLSVFAHSLDALQ